MCTDTQRQMNACVRRNERAQTNELDWMCSMKTEALFGENVFLFCFRYSKANLAQVPQDLSSGPTRLPTDRAKERYFQDQPQEVEEEE